MSWAKLDDGLLDHPKILGIGPVGLALHVAGIVWCARNLTDGYIPVGKVSTLLDLRGVWVNIGNATGYPNGEDVKGGAGAPDPLDVAFELVEGGLWEDVEGGFAVHDFLDYNPSKAAVLAAREAGNSRQTRYRKRHAVSNGGGNGVTNAPVTPEVPGTGTGTGLVSLGSEKKNGRVPGKPSGKRPKVPWPEDFTLTEERLAYAMRNMTEQEARTEWVAFKNWALSKDWRYADWNAGWHTRCINFVKRREEREQRGW